MASSLILGYAIKAILFYFGICFILQRLYQRTYKFLATSSIGFLDIHIENIGPSRHPAKWSNGIKLHLRRGNLNRCVAKNTDFGINCISFRTIKILSKFISSNLNHENLLGVLLQHSKQIK